MWFEKAGYSSNKIRCIQERVIDRFSTPFAGRQPASAPQPAPAARAMSASRFDCPCTEAPGHIEALPDDIVSYLDSPVITLPAGMTVTQYWHGEREKQRHLAEMAITFCSAPATSVDDEGSFSEGRNQCAWNQRSMSSQTVQEKMAMGSWSKAPFFDMGQAVNILEEQTRGLCGSYIAS